MRERIRLLATLLLAGVLLGGSFLVAAPGARAADEQHCFDETGKCVNPAFYDYWQAHGGRPVNGFPISDELVQVLEDGQPYTVQYFERARFEYHPANDKDARVILGQFGRQLHPADPPVAQQPGATFFAETGHNVSGAFLAYWQGNGGLAQFGYPLTEVFAETIDGTSYQVQYFERARFEAHPENAAPYDTLLGTFGRDIYAATGNQTVAPCTAGALRADLQMMAGAGARDGNIHLINTGDAPCALAGAPRVDVLDQHGAPLPVAINGPQGPPSTVGIAAAGRGQAIAVPVRWTNYCGPTPSVVRIVLTLPTGGQLMITDGISIPPCLGAGQPSTFSYQGFTSGPQGEAVANVLLGYFGSINAQDYRAAYAALGSALQAQQPYDTFAAGYATTARVEARQIVISGTARQAPGYDVSLVLTATQADGTVKTYKGTYALGLEDGAWKIVAANVQQQ